MIIYPAIDLIDGKCVRLTQGDFDKQSTYSSDPISMAKSFCDLGSEWIHVVDLDGAKAKESKQLDLIGNIANSVPANIQTGGGFRTIEDIRRAFDCGIGRIIIGSLCVTNPELVCEWIEEFSSERIAISLDCRIDEHGVPFVLHSGWQGLSKMSLFDVIDVFENKVKHLICTDVGRDGMMMGANSDLYSKIIKKYPSIHLQASGGIGSEDDVNVLRKIPVSGVIVGKAIYENKIDLNKILRA